MGFHLLRSMSATLVAFLMVMCATPAGCSDPDPYGLVFNRNPLSWADAEAHCVSLGGHLASVSSEAMARHIDVNYVRGGGACHATWIGYNDRATEGDWVWTGAASSYTNWWQPSGPNDMDSGEDCASLGVDCIYGFSGVASGWADSAVPPETTSTMRGPRSARWAFLLCPATRSTPAQSHGTRPVRTANREAEISPPSTPRRRTERPWRSLVGVTHGLGSMAKRTSTTMCGRMGRRWTTMGGRRDSRTIMVAMRTVEGIGRAATTVAGTICLAARAAVANLLTFATPPRQSELHMIQQTTPASRTHSSATRAYLGTAAQRGLPRVKKGGVPQAGSQSTQVCYHS